MMYCASWEENFCKICFPTNMCFSALRYYLFEIILYFKSLCEVWRKNKPGRFYEQGGRHVIEVAAGFLAEGVFAVFWSVLCCLGRRRIGFIKNRVLRWRTDSHVWGLLLLAPLMNQNVHQIHMWITDWITSWMPCLVIFMWFCTLILRLLIKERVIFRNIIIFRNSMIWNTSMTGTDIMYLYVF